jgi:amino acid adenylation domain-containing protein
VPDRKTKNDTSVSLYDTSVCLEEKEKKTNSISVSGDLWMMTTFVTATPSSASRFICVSNAVAAQPPGNLALTDEASSLAYGELNCRANRLACHLRSLGVRAGTVVGLCLPRSLDMVVGALGILKAGGAYLPLDPAYPADRLAFMLDDAQAPVLVTVPSLARRLATTKRDVVDMNAPEIAAYPDRPPLLETAPSDLAYVIYTSGSTGTPKGVEITHSNLTNLVSWHEDAFSITATDRASHVAGLGFDAAVWELWPYLATGASVHLAHGVTRTSPECLRDWLVAQRITISFVPTPLAERLLTLEWPRTSALRIVLTGGDTLRRYPPPNLPFALINNYGPTECAVVATSGRVESDGCVDVLPPIGRAIANAEVYILDEWLDHTAAGTPGEIYIGGAGVARGYRNRPDLTAEKFISNPFSADAGSRLFKTGDLGRFLPDGQIGFLGRVDDQIKIRGYRIEPNEIVGLLNRRPEIRQSIVIAREDTPDDRRLIAYLVMDPDARVTHTGLRDFLHQYLPDYMLPTAFVRLDGFQLTTNGKIDRAALPPPSPTNTVADPVSPVANTPVERRTAEIVAELLDLKEVARDDNFFLLGGHSLLGAQLIARLEEAFGVEIALRSLFDAPTVAGLASEIELLAGAHGNPAPRR